jgi:glycosyltransferase involved in cell wall biosynthesis
MKLLICSLSAPYDAVPHAGGQTHNYYLKRLIQEKEIETHLLTFSYIQEYPKLDLDKYHISSSIIILDKNLPILKKIHRKFLGGLYNHIIWLGYSGFISGYCKYKLKQELLALKKNGYTPDIIELNWTQILFLYQMVVRIFPYSKYCAVEQDVSLLRFEREYNNAKGFLKLHKKLIYHMIKKKEFALLSKMDIIFTFSGKDKNILDKQNISNVEAIIPFFKKIVCTSTLQNKKSILFFGQMSRPENYLSAIWFIENVFNKYLSDDFVFIVLGAYPNEKLLKYKSEKVIITGYQEDIEPWFEKALCLVAPLHLGAGIKIKILEALSSGIPVLCSDVASEGIDIRDNVEYFRCTSPEDYINKIKLLFANPDIAKNISSNAKRFIDENYDLEKSFSHYLCKLKILIA